MTHRPSAVAAALLAAGLLSACATSTAGSPAATSPASSSPTSPRHPHPSTPRISRPASTSPSRTPASTRPSVTTHPIPGKPLRTNTVTASDGTVYAISVWAEQESEDCAAHAYGEVARFLAAHRCTGIHQVLATTAIEGKAVGFAQNSVGFAGGMNKSYRAAGDFRDLVSSNGTGNLNDLLREAYRLPAGPDSVPSPDAFSALGQDAGVVVTDAWYLDNATPENDPPLVKMAQDIFLQI